MLKYAVWSVVKSSQLTERRPCLAWPLAWDVLVVRLAEHQADVDEVVLHYYRSAQHQLKSIKTKSKVTVSSSFLQLSYEKWYSQIDAISHHLAEGTACDNHSSLRSDFLSYLCLLSLIMEDLLYKLNNNNNYYIDDQGMKRKIAEGVCIGRGRDHREKRWRDP